MVYTCPLTWRGHVYTIENSVSVETAMRGLSTAWVASDAAAIRRWPTSCGWADVRARLSCRRRGRAH